MGCAWNLYWRLSIDARSCVGCRIHLDSVPIIFSLVRILGAVYLAWMGYGLLLSGQQRWSMGSDVKPMRYKYA